MIKSDQQAYDIQSLRVANGKRGYSSAVRTYLKKKYRTPNGNLDWHAYNAAKQDFPSLPIVREEEPPEVNGNSVDYVPPVEVKPTRKPRSRHAKAN